jgi:hypothetical protein
MCPVDSKPAPAAGDRPTSPTFLNHIQASLGGINQDDRERISVTISPDDFYESLNALKLKTTRRKPSAMTVRRAPGAISSVGAPGIAQFMPETALTQRIGPAIRPDQVHGKVRIADLRHVEAGIRAVEKLEFATSLSLRVCA